MSTFKMGDIIPLIQQEAIAQGVDPAQAIAIFVAENTSDGVVKSDRPVSLDTQGIDPATGQPSGALGLFQVTGTTLKNLKLKGYVPPDLDYTSLSGQIKAGVSAVKEAFQVAGGVDPLAGAAQYVNGSSGLAGYKGAAPMPTQTASYLPKVAKAMGVSYTGKVIPTEVKGALDSSMAGYASTSAQTTSMLQAMGVELDTQTAAQTGALKDSATANAAVLTSAADQRASELLRDQAMLKTFNLQTDQLQTAMDQVASSQHQMNAVKPTIDALNAINPFANPVKWIAAQFQLGALTPQYDAAKANSRTAVENLAAQQALAASQAKLTPAVTLGQISSERDANIQLKNATLTAQIAESNMRNITARRQTIIELQGIAGTTAQLNMANARLQAETLGIRRDEQIKSDQQFQLDKINLTRTQYGAPPLQTWQQLSALPKDQQDFYINASTETTTPGKAIRNINAMGTINALQRNEQTQAMGDQAALIFQAAQPEIAKVEQMPGRNIKHNDAIEEGVQVTYDKWRKELPQGMDKLTSGNPYKMNVQQYAMAPELASNSVAGFVKTSGKAVPNMSDKEILSFAIGQLNAKRPVADVAKEVTEFYSKGGEFQFKKRGLSTLGFDARTLKDPATGESKIAYPISADIFGWWSTTFGGAPVVDKAFDLTNIAEVTQFLVMNQIKQAQNTAMQAGSPLSARRMSPEAQQRMEQQQ